MNSEARPEIKVETGNSQYEGVGFSPKAGWYNAAVMNAVVGAMIISMHVFTDWLPPYVEIIGYITAGLVPVWILGARFMPDAHWAAHVRILVAMANIAAAAILVGPLITAIALVVLLPLSAISYLLSPRLSIPYNVLGLLITTPILVAEAPFAAAISTTMVLATTALALVLSQHKLRGIAQVNNQLAVRDPLTGLANVRGLRTRLAREIAVADRTGEMPYLFTIDLDDFKLVNDRFNHTVGDEVLRETANELAGELTPTDLLARRGGDEFAVLCGPLARRDVDDLRERLVLAVRRARARVCPTINTNGSVAYVRMLPGENAAGLLNRADDALHEAKIDAHPDRRDTNLSVVGSSRAVRRLRIGRPARKPTVDHRAAGAAGETAQELELTRRAQRALSTRSNWLIAAATNAIFAAFTLLLPATGLVSTRLALFVGIAVSIFVLGAVAALIAARRMLAARWMPIVPVAMLATLTLAAVGLGPDRWVIADLFLVPILFAAFTLSPKRAVPPIGAGFLLLVGVLVSADYPYVSIRGVFTFCIIMSVCSMLIKARKQTWSFTKNAVETSSIDPLTGATNLRGLRARVADEIGRCSVDDSSLVMLSIDLDEFKSVNDRYSHTTGDEVLVAVTRAIASEIRAEDLVARRGGDEFSVVVAVQGPGDVGYLVDRIATAIETVRAKICPDVLPTASIGLSRWRANESLDEFLKRGDDELHEAKLTSRETRAMSDEFSARA